MGILLPMVGRFLWRVRRTDSIKGDSSGERAPGASFLVIWFATETKMLTSPSRRVGLLSLLAILLAVPVHAQTRTQIDVSKLGPQVGARVPDFTLADQSGRQRTLQSIMGPRGAMLVFVRSADW